MEQNEYKLCVAVARVLGCYNVLYSKIVNEQPDSERAAMEARIGKLKGMPDYLVFGRSSTDPNLAIEVKSGKGKLSTEQTRVLMELRDRGWVILVARTIDDVVSMMDSLYGR
jgi:hypothetical protein